MKKRDNIGGKEGHQASNARVSDVVFAARARRSEHRASIGRPTADRAVQGSASYSYACSVALF